MKTFSALTSFALLSLQSQPILAYWRMACGVSQTSRIDPILSPGSVSGHVHKLAGGINVNQFSTQQSLQASKCSTCEVQADKSAYWTPQLYYEHADGSIEEVQNDGMTVYYVGRGGDSSNTVPFPEGFKMISGNSLLRSYDEQNLTYLNIRPIADRTHYLHETNCVNGLRAQINFQSCWDGVNLYSPGNTHVAYLSGIDYGVCPPTHPVPIPGLFFEVLYWTNRINQGTGGRFVFANGDATGFGFHGDFMNGWDQTTQTRAVKQCLYTDNGGSVLACPTLAESANENFARICPQSPQVYTEVVKGMLPEKRLPGCNPITTGPTSAQQAVCPLESSSSAKSSLSTTSSSRTRPTTSMSSMSTRLSTATFASTRSTTRATTSTSSGTPTTFSSTVRSSPSITSGMGGVFVTVSTISNTTDPSVQESTSMTTSTTSIPITELANTNSAIPTAPPTIIVYNSTELIAIGNVTITSVTVRTTTVSPSEYCSVFSSAGLLECQTLSPSPSEMMGTMTVTDSGTETKTAFVTVFSPVTLNITAVTEVTITATPLAENRKREQLVTYRLRGREIVRRKD